LRDELQQSGQRALLLLQADSTWLEKVTYRTLVTQGDMVVTERAVEGVQTLPPGQAENLLGLQFNRVIYECGEALDANVLCMLAGLVEAGGDLIIVSTGWDERGFFSRWLVERLANCRVFFDLGDATELPEIETLSKVAPTPIVNGLTTEQHELLNTLQRWSRQQSHGVFLLTADRGRGKSTALGRFAQQMARERSVTVCAPSKSQVQVLFRQLSDERDVVYMAPDEFIRRGEKVALLVIDEAAMIPGSVLWQCLELAQQTVMETTTGGDEGSGRGFLLRFVEELQRLTPLTRHSLEHPVRWGQNDLLEQVLNRELMLGSDPLIEMEAVCGEPAIQRIAVAELRNDPQLLQGVYHLLVAAHYRTRPSDLARLLDDEAQILLVARIGMQVVGVLLMNSEGGFAAQLSEEIFLGKRRPQGHLLAQMLTAQAGLPDFATHTGYRIQRIVVDPQLRRRGIGRRLVQQAIASGKTEQSEYLGSCFALDQANVAFWQACGFELVHISAGQGTATARQTVVVLHALGDERLSAIAMLQQRIREALPQWLLSYCRDIYWRDVVALLGLLDIRYSLTPLQQQEIRAFANAHRGFDYAQSTLQRYLIGTLAQADYLEDTARRLVIEKILQNHSWSDVVARAELPGKKAALQLIRQTIREIDEHA
jgi:tRNA(Met) cytidine acetyltransferase